MALLDFLRKKKKVLVTVAGLVLVCICIVLLSWKNEKDETEGILPETQEMSTAEQMPTELSKPTMESEVPEQSEMPEQSEVPEQPEVPEQSEVPEQPLPMEEPKPVLSEEYELVYEGISVFRMLSSSSYMKYKDLWADLYMRRQQDDAGEFIELSVWYEGEELWRTRKDDEIEKYPLFWHEEYSKHLTLEQGQSYYVVELDGDVYLMEYSVETTSNMVTMSYKVVGIKSHLMGGKGYSAPYDAGSISCYIVKGKGIAPAVSFPVEQMTAFADTVQGYMEKGQRVATTLHGEFEFGVPADEDNSISPYLYDIFPWIPQMAAQYGVAAEGIHSTEELLIALQNALPTEEFVMMPALADDGNSFITGDYHSHRDESYLTVRMNEDGSYRGGLLIDNVLIFEFTGYYENGILTITQIQDDTYSQPPCELEITFQDGVATGTLTVVNRGVADVGDVIILDRNAEPMDFKYLQDAGDYDKWK